MNIRPADSPEEAIISYAIFVGAVLVCRLYYYIVVENNFLISKILDWEIK